MNEQQLTRLGVLQFFNSSSALIESMKSLEQLKNQCIQFENNFKMSNDGLCYLIGKNYQKHDFTDIVISLGNLRYNISQEIEKSLPLFEKSCQTINTYIAEMEKIIAALSTAQDLTEEEKLHLSALNKKVPYIKTIQENAENQLIRLENFQEDLNTLQGILESNNDLEKLNSAKKSTRNKLITQLIEDCQQSRSKANDILEDKNSQRLIGILSAISIECKSKKELVSTITLGYLTKIAENNPKKEARSQKFKL